MAQRCTTVILECVHLIIQVPSWTDFSASSIRIQSIRKQCSCLDKERSVRNPKMCESTQVLSLITKCLNLLYYGLLTWVVFMLQILELIRTDLDVAGQSGRYFLRWTFLYILGNTIQAAIYRERLTVVFNVGDVDRFLLYMWISLLSGLSMWCTAGKKNKVCSAFWQLSATLKFLNA